MKVGFRALDAGRETHVLGASVGAVWQMLVVGDCHSLGVCSLV